MEMKVVIRYCGVALLIAGSTVAHGQTMQLTTNVPECRMPTGQALPDKYYNLAKRHKEFRWVLKMSPATRAISGSGWERVDGSSMFEWFRFSRVDLNNDGYCDWYVNALVPVSTGGDRDSINTIYLGSSKGWKRVGFDAPNDKPDSLGEGKSYDQQDEFLFGEDLAVVRDAGSNVNYIITAFLNRHNQHSIKPGYRIFDWDTSKQSLRLLDKWQPGSKAAAVYAFFKTHGGWEPGNEPVAPSQSSAKFDADIETTELEEACDPLNQRRRWYVAPSVHLLARCKR
jgi:hypothetical protein